MGEIQLKVDMNDVYAHYDNIEVNYTDTIIQNTKELIRYKFDKKIQARLLDKNTYIATLPPQSTNLLGPLRIGFPIKKIYLEGPLGNDSAMFILKKADMKKQLKKGKLKKVNWTYFIYIYK
jgi:hypothetical protein